MPVFVLSTGRCGSMTFARACSHATNFTAAHESGLRDRHFRYPENHIEVDNRLSWMLGRLGEQYPYAEWVHLRRDHGVAESYAKRWNRYRSLVRAVGENIMRFPCEQSSAPEAARALVDIAEANIREFLSRRSYVTVRLEHIRSDFPAFWRDIKAEGDLDAALAEFGTRWNASA